MNRSNNARAHTFRLLNNTKQLKHVSLTTRKWPDVAIANSLGEALLEADIGVKPPPCVHDVIRQRPTEGDIKELESRATLRNKAQVERFQWYERGS